MRKFAGQLINDYLREGRLSANRSNPIGAGSYGTVYQSDRPGYVMKQVHDPDGLYGRNLEDEVNLQAIAAEAGLAPQVAGLEKFPGGVGNRMEMADIRDNYYIMDDLPTAKQDLQIQQQLGELALRGVRLEDRRPANIAFNKTTGRPLQLDFGIAGKVKGSEQVATLAMATADGFSAAGLDDIAGIYRATVIDLLEGGNVTDAMDVAKQGFSRLQKLKGPIPGTKDPQEIQMDELFAALERGQAKFM